MRQGDPSCDRKSEKEKTNQRKGDYVMLKYDSKSANELLKILEAQEASLVFDSFTNEDALRLGTILSEITKNCPKSVTARVFLGDIIVFQYTMAGDEKTRFGWTERKYALIRETLHSSMHGKIRALMLGELRDLYENKEKYGFGCGGFPIVTKDKGLIGAVALSGLPDPADHIYVIRALEIFTGREVPHLPEEINEEWIDGLSRC